ncbi:MAG: altronate oxidoreductase [Firmicutes bacterium HGW-Firmicutes-1]|jgi:tagaturonate reductase|nr:MAG: altronate oxidoreductase [Firmicutes bacterium HGW-Firmicutes-1]
MKNLNQSIISKVKRPIKILQFGEGNFLRAFVDWIIQAGNDQGVINTNVAVVQPLELGRVKNLAEQDGLYTLYLEGLQAGEAVSKQSVISVLDDFINPYESYDAYLEYAKSEDLRFIISNTTEAGIVLDLQDTDLTKCPASFPGKLLALLYNRYLHFEGDYQKGLIILPCELIDHNGHELNKVLNELALLNNLEADFFDWLNDANIFCDTLVDRIVPGYPVNEIDTLTKALGYFDHSIIKGELFHLWVIGGDEKVEKEFPVNLAGLNVLFVKDITPYKERKVRILNGAHTALVPVAYLYGIDTVKEALEDEILGEFVEKMIFDEIIPTLDLPVEECIQFAKDVLQRFKNPFIRHELLSISLNATTKYKTRDLPSVIASIERKGTLPRRLLFSLASQLVFFKGEREGATIPLQDNKEFLELYTKLWAQYDGSYESVESITATYLGLKEHWGIDLNAIEGLNDFITKSVYLILKEGMKKALSEVVG